MKQKIKHIIDKNTVGNYLLSNSDKEKIINEIFELLNNIFKDIFNHMKERTKWESIDAPIFTEIRELFKTLTKTEE